MVLLGMHFDAVVVFVTNQTLLFRLALAILWIGIRPKYFGQSKKKIGPKEGQRIFSHSYSHLSI